VININFYSKYPAMPIASDMRKQSHRNNAVIDSITTSTHCKLEREVGEHYQVVEA